MFSMNVKSVLECCASLHLGIGVGGRSSIPIGENSYLLFGDFDGLMASGGSIDKCRARFIDARSLASIFLYKIKRSNENHSK